MATEDNVRFVRYLFELGVGGRQALREIIIREVSSRSQPLENLLSENRHRFKSDELLTQLFQADGKINTNIEQWDIRLLYNVIKSLFWSSISSRERGAIKTLNSHRKDVQRNPDGTSVMEVEYRTIRDDLRTAIFDIAEAMDGTRRQQLRAIVSRSGAADLDIQFALRQICELNEFADDLLQSLEQRFRETNRGVDRRRVNTSFRAVGAISKNVEVEENSDVQNQENDTYMTDIHGSALEIQETNNNAGFHQVHSDFSIGISIVIFLLYLKGLDKCFLA
ncbi:uncharacterized protein LOC132743842 [Ruditapes philippinarum]|uniref:uncharacterized protein LOC132743842 n=1 Tax=Ruditapes philippinarum TaxID=129788 RepID=UPI00295BBD78|nr:uncharacterized protein LOC132743842 [Ruditapes philippinarum]